MSLQWHRVTYLASNLLRTADVMTAHVGEQDPRSR